jgi:hypothetical protein
MTLLVLLLGHEFVFEMSRDILMDARLVAKSGSTGLTIFSGYIIHVPTSGRLASL